MKLNSAYTPHGERAVAPNGEMTMKITRISFPDTRIPLNSELATSDGLGLGLGFGLGL